MYSSLANEKISRDTAAALYVEWKAFGTPIIALAKHSGVTRERLRQLFRSLDRVVRRDRDKTRLRAEWLPASGRIGGDHVLRWISGKI